MLTRLQKSETAMSVLLPLFMIWKVVVPESGHAQQLNRNFADPTNLSKPAFVPGQVNSFVENRGQLFDQNAHSMPEVHYYFDGNGVRLYAAEHSLHFVFAKIDGNRHDPRNPLSITDTSRRLTLYRTDLTFPGSNEHPHIEALDKKESYDNYYLVSCPNGLTNVPEFGTVIYHDLYPHIDLELIGVGSSTKYEFIVHPGGDPSIIRAKYDDRESLALQDDGSVTISNPLGQIMEPAPISYQNERRIDTRYKVRDNEIEYTISSYDSTSDLVIDPPRLWGTYYGGVGQDVANAVASDASGNIYVTGWTNSTSNISTTGAYQTTYAANNDAFIVKFNSAGTRQWGTYAGGLGFEVGAAIVVDHNGDVVVAGTTSSYTTIATTGAYQTTFGGQSDAFLMKFNNSGSRLWGSYYGSIQWDRGYAVAVDASNNIILGGSYGAATNNGMAMVAKFNSTGSSLLWSTTWGYQNPIAGDAVFGVTVDNSANIYVTGAAYSSSSFTTPGAYQTSFGGPSGGSDAFLAKLTSSGSISWCTYYGGSGYDYGQGISTDGTYLYATGWTSSSSNVATTGAFLTTFTSPNEAYLSKWSYSGSLLWGTYYGAGADNATAVAVDSNHDIIFAGLTGSSSGIATTGEYQTTYLNNGIANPMAFMAKFNSSGSRQWGTYYGTGDEELGYGLAIDPINNILFVGYTGTTSGSLATTGAQQTTPGGGGQDAFVVKFCGIVQPAIQNSGRDTLCQGTSITLTAPTGFTSYQWTLNGTNISGATTNSFTVPNTLAPGTYNYALAVSNPQCSTTSLTRTILVHSNPTAVAGANRSICSGDATTIGGTATGGKTPYTYAWTPSATLNDPTLATPIAHPTSTTTYTVIVTDSNGCQNSQNVTVTVNPVPALSVTHQVETCQNTSIQIGATATGGMAPYSYSWYPATGLNSSTIAQPLANPLSTTKYFDTVTDANGCHTVDSVVVTIDPVPSLIITQSRSICIGASVTLSASTTSGTGAMTYSWSPAAGLSSTTVANPTATPTVSTTYTVLVTDSKGCSITGQTTLTVNPLPVPNIIPSGTIAICEGDSVTLTTDQPYLGYQWSDGEGTNKIVVKQSGIYSVSVLDADGCSGASKASVTVVTHARPVASTAGPTSVCPNETDTYSAPPSNSETYSWQLTGGGTITSGAGTPNCTINWTAAGSWRVSLHVVDTSTGCSKDSSIAVNVSSALSPTIQVNGSTTLCQGDSVTLVAPAGYKSYAWSSGETTSQILVKKSGSYSVQVTSTGGCSGSSAPVTVTVNNSPRPTPTISVTQTTICAGDSVVLSITQSYSSYKWSTGATTPTIVVSKAGAYSVSVLNASGCSGTSIPVTITASPKPVVSLNASGPTSFCEGDSVTLSVTAGYAYRWSVDGTSLTDTTASILAKTAGTYSVVATNGGGCSDSAKMAIVVNPRPNAAISGPSSICIGGIAGYRVASVSGNTISWQIKPSALGSIQAGQGTDSITVQWGSQGTGTLDVTVANSDGCSATSSMSITVDTHLNPTITANGPLTFCAGDSVTLDAGFGYASYQWSKDGNTLPTTTTEKFVSNQSGQYSVYVTNTTGCNGSSQPMKVTVYPLPSKPVITQNGSQLASTSAMHYLWLRNGISIKGDTTQTIAADSLGTYSVTIGDANGCDATSDPYPYSVQGSVSVTLTKLTRVAPNDPFTISLGLADVTNLVEAGVTSYAGTLRIPASLATPVNPTGIMSGSDWIIPIGGSWTKGQTSLQTLSFKAGVIDPDCDILTVDSFYFPKAFISVTSDTATICVDGLCHPWVSTTDTTLAIHRVTPNPSNGNFWISYHIADSGPVDLYVEDVLGRATKYFLQTSKPAGTYEDSFTAEDLPSGLYRLILRNGTRTRSTMVEFDR